MFYEATEMPNLRDLRIIWQIISANNESTRSGTSLISAGTQATATAHILEWVTTAHAEWGAPHHPLFRKRCLVLTGEGERMNV